MAQLALLILTTATLRWTYPDHRGTQSDCNAPGDSLLSLDSVRVERQVSGWPHRIIYWQGSARGLEGTRGSIVVPADTASTFWVLTRASKGPWSCSSNPAGVGSYPLGVPPGAAARESVLVDVSGRTVSGKVPGVNVWKVARRGKR